MYVLITKRGCKHRLSRIYGEYGMLGNLIYQGYCVRVVSNYCVRIVSSYCVRIVSSYCVRVVSNFFIIVHNSTPAVTQAKNAHSLLPGCA